MPFKAYRLKCKIKSTGKPGSHTLYKIKKNNKKEKIGCTNQPEAAIKARYAAEKGSINEDKELLETIENMVREELENILEKKKKKKSKTRKNEPTNPALWGRAKAAARSKFDVYPSAYANAWAAKWYKKRGGKWRKKK